MLLIFPPVAKACEPPAGVALLSSALKGHGMDCQVYDANIEGQLFLIRSVEKADDSWTRRAQKNRESLISDLRNPALYRNMDRYHQRVYDLNRLLSVSVDQERFRITLSDYSDNQLSSVDSKGLLGSASAYRENPFYPFFEEKVRPRVASLDSDWVGNFPVLSQPGPGQLCPGRVDPRQFPRQKAGYGRGAYLFLDPASRVCQSLFRAH